MLVEVGALISWCIYSYRIVMLLVPYMLASMTFLLILLLFTAVSASPSTSLLFSSSISNSSVSVSTSPSTSVFLSSSESQPSSIFASQSTFSIGHSSVTGKPTSTVSIGHSSVTGKPTPQLSSTVTQNVPVTTTTTTGRASTALTSLQRDTCTFKSELSQTQESNSN